MQIGQILKRIGLLYMCSVVPYPISIPVKLPTKRNHNWIGFPALLAITYCNTRSKLCTVHVLYSDIEFSVSACELGSMAGIISQGRDLVPNHVTAFDPLPLVRFSTEQPVVRNNSDDRLYSRTPKLRPEISTACFKSCHGWWPAQVDETSIQRGKWQSGSLEIEWTRA